MIKADNAILRSPSVFKDRLRSEQVGALFRNVTFGVVGAALSAAVLAAEVVHLGAASVERGALWASYIAGCALLHGLLHVAYGRSGPVQGLTAWAIWFTVFSLAEGFGWGWATTNLVTVPRVDVELLVMVVAYAIAAGSLPIFSPYLPAFFAIFLPTTAPFLIMSTLSVLPVERAGALLSVLFIVVMGGLGIRANLTFKELIRLRLETQNLANDLRQQKDIAEQANLAKSSFLAAASHDLRQPVHALGLFVAALRGTRLPPEALRLIEQIDASVVAMDSLFMALLDISRLDAGVVEVHRQAVALQPLLDRLGRDYADQAEEKAVRLVLLPSSAVVLSDAVLLERILRNLISNAVRYTDAGRVLVGCRRVGAAVSVEVWDTGRGIPIDLQQKIFQEYFQLGNPERDRAKGLGLGLAIVRRMTDLLGCDLAVRSEPGRGSCFSVRLPLASTQQIQTQPTSEAQGGFVTGGLVVIVDDESAIRDAMSTLLVAWGFDVVAAASGDEIIALLADCPVRPDVIISDYRLRAGENGIDVIERLQSEYNEAIPAMLVTGDTDPGRLVEAESSGLLLLHKPVSRSKLRAGISSLVARSRYVDPARSDQPTAPPSLTLEMVQTTAVSETSRQSFLDS